VIRSWFAPVKRLLQKVGKRQEDTFSGDADEQGCSVAVSTNVPGRNPIRLPAFYEEFREYYPNCEMETKNWFVTNIQPEWTMLDCGANIGYYSILFSQLAPRGKVYAFEPTSTVNLLKANLEANSCGNVEVLKLAVGKHMGRIQEGIFRIWGHDAEMGEYDFITIDGFILDRRLSRLDCIKIDVDSFDFEVLLGAEESLEKFNPWIVVELNHALNKRGQSDMEALEWLASRGYSEALVLDQENFVLHKASESIGRPQLTLKWKAQVRA